MPVLSKESEEEKENIGNIEANNSIKENEFPVNGMVIITRENVDSLSQSVSDKAKKKEEKKPECAYQSGW